MTVPDTDTLVTYPDNETVSTGIVTRVIALPAGEHGAADFGVLLDRTAFHPVDTAWPDQPSDVGVMRMAAGETPVHAAVLGAAQHGVASDGELFIGTDVPVRTGTEGWVFSVVHLISGPAPAVGERVTVKADPELRAALCAGHTACHIAALALDAALADAWKKPVSEDALGSPAFDALAIQSSRIEPMGSVDVYRIGKSLKRKGFTVDALENLASVEARVNERLAAWVAAGGPVRIERQGLGISARRSWVCELAELPGLPGGRVEIPCGGTHVTELRDLARVEVSLERAEVTGGVELTMRTVVAAT